MTRMTKADLVERNENLTEDLNRTVNGLQSLLSDYLAIRRELEELRKQKPSQKPSQQPSQPPTKYSPRQLSNMAREAGQILGLICFADHRNQRVTCKGQVVTKQMLDAARAGHRVL